MIYAAESKHLIGNETKSFLISPTYLSQRSFSPESYNRSVYALTSVSSAFFRSNLRASASDVFFISSLFKILVYSSNSSSCTKQSFAHFVLSSNCFCSLFSSLSNGSIYSNTCEYLIFATTQAAKGAVALDTPAITSGLKLFFFFSIIFET